MTILHAYFHLRNQQAYQRLLDASRAQAQASANASNAPTLSSSAGKSWTRPSALSNTAAATVNVNARDHLGRTVLHLACSTPAHDTSALEYMKLLLAHPRIDVNLPDAESRWTPLHRALYEGNLPACVLLLQRPDIDIAVKDYEGYTPFDVYNATVEGTKPSPSGAADLYTWGTNRNATLGTGDADDRAYPEQVPMPPMLSSRQNLAPEMLPLRERFCPATALVVSMARLHAAVVTIEQSPTISASSPVSSSSLRLCGIGSGNRLGSISQHAQYSFSPLRDTQLANEAAIVSVALGTDHTLALTNAGIVLSFGSNRFAQLGYVIEPSNSSGVTASGSGAALTATGQGQQTQMTPRRVVGPLKKEVVKGVAACRTASACWTETDCYTWGTNGGQLGYNKIAQQVQVLPRRVTQVTQPVVDLAMSDNAMCILLASRDVLCFWGGKHFKINFPTQNFPSEIQAYRPPMAKNNAEIAKVVSCENTFAALSSNGEVFTFTLNAPPTTDGSPPTYPKGHGATSSTAIVKPQRLWALRKQFSAVRDVALGADGMVILCTESGHVYVRQCLGKGGSFKFSKVPGLQRVLHVAASEAGAFAAIRADCEPTSIKIPVNGVEGDLAQLRPWLVVPGRDKTSIRTISSPGSPTESSPIEVGSRRNGGIGSPIEEGDPEAEDDNAESVVRHDLEEARRLLDILEMDDKRRRGEGKGLYDLDFGTSELPPQIPRHWLSGGGAYGADLVVRTGEKGAFEFPAHTTVLAARSPVLLHVLAGHLEEGNVRFRVSPSEPGPKGRHSVRILTVSGVHSLSVLLFATYLYTDDVPRLWDEAVAAEISNRLQAFPPMVSAKTRQAKKISGVTVSQIQSELRSLANLFKLESLSEALALPFRRACDPCAAKALASAFREAQLLGVTKSANTHPLGPDVILNFSDNSIYAHSAVLRARSPFFEALFDEPVWTVRRWSDEGLVEVNLRHMRWRVMEFVLRWVYEGGGEELFERLEFVQSMDEVLGFMFEVMGSASELLLDPLILVCSSVILRFVNVSNACSLLSDACHYSAHALITSLHGYIARNMETLLEARALDDLPLSIIRGLANFVRKRQAEKLGTSRHGVLVARAMRQWGEWLALQDIPQVIVPSRTASGRVMADRSKQIPRLSPEAVVHANRIRPMPTLGQAPNPAPTTANSPLLVQRFTPPLAAVPIREREDERTGATASGADDIFTMDQEEIPPLSLATPTLGSSTSVQPMSSTPKILGPWENRLAQQHVKVKTDLRSIMEAESKQSAMTAATSTFQAGTSPAGRARVPSRTKTGYDSDHGPPSAPRTPQKAPAAAVVDKTSGPWRQRAPIPSPSLVLGSSTPSGLSRAIQGSGTGSTLPPRLIATPSPSIAGGNAGGSRKGKVVPMLGPTYTPIRQPSGLAVAVAPMARRTLDGTGKPWTAVPSAFSSSPPLPAQTQLSTTSTSPPSFLAIQQQQLNQSRKGASKAKKSLLQIQEEERARQAEEEKAAWARKEEEEFMRWWAAEEERIRKETQAKPGPPVSVPAGSGEGARGGKKNRSGRGRGKDKERGAAEPGAGPSADKAQNQNANQEREWDVQCPPRAHRPRGGKNLRHPVSGQPQQV